MRRAGSAGVVEGSARGSWGPAPALGALLFWVLLPGAARAQERSVNDPSGFVSLDVSTGPTWVRSADLALGYGAGMEIADLPVPHTLTRFGFRFWTTEDPTGARDTVLIDDFAFSVQLRRRVGGRTLGLYGGVGPSLHLVTADLSSDITATETRDGVKPGADFTLGAELAPSDPGFLQLFVEGTGSLVSKVSHLSLQGGLRLHFDRLGGS